MTDLIDTRLGPYHLTEVLGRGGMATIYKAYQASLERFVAVKVLRHDHDPQFVARFKREALAIAHLQHPNILPVYEFGEQNGRLYLVCQYIESEATLADMFGEPLEPVAALRLIGHLLRALDYAHTRGIIHRDIKPTNVLMLSPTWPMLADFGIVRMMSDRVRLTVSGTIIGTAAYMAPEQASGEEVDARADLYSTGVVLYELLTGRVPFDGDTPIAVLLRHRHDPPPPPRTVNPRIPVVVETALLRALAKDPGDRYQTAADMARVLEQTATQIERGALRGQLDDLYRTGLREFRAGHWVAAIDALERLVALDAAYEDGLRLLEQARAAQEFAQREVRRPSVGRTTQLEREPPAEPIVAPARCARCGHETQSTWTVCPYCGARLNQAAAKPSRRTTRPLEEHALGRSWFRDRMWPAAAILLLALAALGGGVWVALGSGDPPRSPPTAIQTPELFGDEAMLSNPTSVPVPTPVPLPTTVPKPASTSTPMSTSTSTPTPEPTSTPAPTDAPAPPPDALVDSPQWNLRSGPGTAFPRIGLYNQGDRIEVLGKEPTGQWLRVRTPDEQVGWMAREGLHLNLDIAGVPIVPSPPTPTPPPTRRPPTPRPLPPTEPPTPTEPLPTPTLEPTPTPPPPTATLTPTKDKDDDDECSGGRCTPEQP